MPFLKEQIELINAGLRACALNDKRFQSGRFEAIAVDVSRLVDENKVEVFPAVMSADHEAHEITVNDTYPITIYHKVVGKNYGRQAIQPQYGSGFDAMTERVEMKMVVAGNSSRLQLSQEQLEGIITTGFPDQIAAASLASLQLDMMRVDLVSSNMITAQVFAEEYRGFDLFLSAEDILFSVRYTIETRFRKGCVNIYCGETACVATTAPCSSSTSCSEVYSIDVFGDDTGSYFNTALIGASVLQVHLDGVLRPPTEYTFNSSTGTVSFSFTFGDTVPLSILYK